MKIREPTQEHVLTNTDPPGEQVNPIELSREAALLFRGEKRPSMQRQWMTGEELTAGRERIVTSAFQSLS